MGMDIVFTTPLLVATTCIVVSPSAAAEDALTENGILELPQYGLGRSKFVVIPAGKPAKVMFTVRVYEFWKAIRKIGLGLFGV
jgi:hypothetical protein